MLLDRRSSALMRARREAASSGPVQLRSSVIAERLRMEQQERAGQRIDFMPWALRVPEPKAGRLNFDAFPPQRELYLEAVDDKEVVIQKGTQVGVSAWAVRWALYHADTKGWTGLYVFPTSRDMYDWSTLRVGPVIDGSDYLRTRRTPSDPANKGLRGIGFGALVLRGSESKRGLDSVDADHIVFDEYDTLSHENIPDAERRISSPLSPGLLRRVGVPSVPDWGISQAFDQSDQRRWFVKCSHCGDYQDIDFFKNVDIAQGIRVCRTCSKPIEDVIRDGKGEWVAQFPDRDKRGYHYAQLSLPYPKLTEIIRNSQRRTPSEKLIFFNKDLGLPHAPAEGRLSKEALQAAQSAGGGILQQPGYAGAKLVTMGVDVASVRDLNVRISEHFSDEKKRALFIGTASSFDDLDSLMRRYGVHMAAIDHLPDGRLSRSFAERFPGRVYLVSYDSTPNPKDSQVLKVDEEMRHARVRRVEAIDAMMEGIRSQRNHLPLDLPEGYVEQMQALNRVVETDEMGKRTVAFRRMGGSDDYAHAETYDIVATELWWYRQGVDELERDEFSLLEDRLEFTRSGLSNLEDEPEYTAGPDLGMYEDPSPY